MTEGFGEYAEIVRSVWPDWEIVEKIGSGAFATVFRASRRNGIDGEKDSAIKIIRVPGSDSDWEMLLAEGKTGEQAERYFQGVVDDSLKEIRAMEELAGNTNIVTIFDYKVHRVPDGRAWYILIRMEYLRKVDTSGMDEDEIIRMGVDVCTALSLCRKKNIVHRDVSLDNVFVHDGNYKLGDFGVAKVLEGSIGTMHSIAGKPLYMAPEVYNGTLADTDIDSAARVDVYSLGILLYRLCNNMKYPFEDPDAENTTAKERSEAFRRRAVEGEALPPPRNASPALAGVILKASAADPDKRFESAEAMKAALVSVAGEAAPVPVRRSRRKAVMIAAALVLLACAAAFFLKPVLFPEWSSWSEWSETRREITDPNNTEEETRERYEWRALQCADCGENNPEDSLNCAGCGKPLSDARTVNAYSDDSVSQVVDGRSVRFFEGKQYWYSGTIPQYRYRDRKQAEQPGVEDICHDWYYFAYEDQDYPGITFAADNQKVQFSISKGEKLFITDYRGNQVDTWEVSFEDGVLKTGSETFTLENGKLFHRYQGATEVYSRKPGERQIPGDRSAAYAKALRPEHYDGTWVIAKYGMNNAYADAEALGLSGKAVIRDGVMTLDWSRNGADKHFEISFDRDLYNGCLHTVVDGTTSWNVLMRADHTILLNIGAYRDQFVMKKENAVDESVVNMESPDFEKAFAEKEDWTVTEEGRTELAKLLIGAAAAGSLDPAAIRTDGPFFLALIGGEPGFPLLVCDGTGDFAQCRLHIGRGVSDETKEPFVYYQWEDCFFEYLSNPETSAAERYRQETLEYICKNTVWPVRIDTE